MPTASAAAFERSMTRLWAYGPRSLIRTTTDLPVRSLVTWTLVPTGKVLCAAVRARVLNRSPLAVFLPWKPGPYQDAPPLWMGLASAAEIAPHTLPRTRAAMVSGFEAIITSHSRCCLRGGATYPVLWRE